MSDLIRQSAATLAAAIASRETSAVEVAQVHLDRIAEVDDKVHAFLHLTGDSALAQAQEIDERIARGEQLGPLAGVRLEGKSN